MAQMLFRFARCSPWFIRLVIALGLQPAVAQADWWWQDDRPHPRVQVAEPFIEWRSGPASGYPVIRVSERGEWLRLMKRKTRWLKVRDGKGREGWVDVADVTRTLDGEGEQVQLTETGLEEFASRSWEGGVLVGQFDSSPVNALYAGYWMTENLSLELWGSQVLGSSAEILFVNANLVHQPFPQWRFSPFFTLGGGQAFIDPKSTLAETEQRNDFTAHAGLGLRIHVTDRYFLRAEVKDYKIFTDRATNEEATEWKVGLSVFF